MGGLGTGRPTLELISFSSVMNLVHKQDYQLLDIIIARDFDSESTI
jgi:hypothetical protein